LSLFDANILLSSLFQTHSVSWWLPFGTGCGNIAKDIRHCCRCENIPEDSVLRSYTLILWSSLNVVDQVWLL
jgi:hypothetical protein